VLAGVASNVSDSDYLANYASQNPQATAVDYLNKVKALYDKRKVRLAKSPDRLLTPTPPKY
jgi:hypothetical protein